MSADDRAAEQLLIDHFGDEAAAEVVAALAGAGLEVRARVVGGTDGPDQNDPAAVLAHLRRLAHVANGPVGMDPDEADAQYLNEAARRVEAGALGHGSTVAATVAGLLRGIIPALVRAPGAVVAAPPGDEAALRVAPLTVKMLREHLCSTQTGTTGHVSAALGYLIAECDRHRPLGPDGKHGTRHTTTCGCEDTAPPPVINPATWTVIEAHAGAVPAAAPPGDEDKATRAVLDLTYRAQDVHELSPGAEAVYRYLDAGWRLVPPAPPAGHEDEAAVERVIRAWLTEQEVDHLLCLSGDNGTRGLARAALAAARSPRTPDPGASA